MNNDFKHSWLVFVVAALFLSMAKSAAGVGSSSTLNASTSTDKNSTVILRPQPKVAQTKEPDIAIYLLANPQLILEDVVRRPLPELALASEPWLSPPEIALYDASTHIIFFKAGVKPKKINASVQGTPFVLMARGQRLFLGAFWPLHSSLLPDAGTPLIYPMFPGCMEYIQIRAMKMQQRGRRWETIPNQEIYRLLEKAFRKADCLHAGLKLGLKAIQVRSHSQEGPTVRYTYCLTNQDTDIFLVLDPDKTGSPLFHYFTNGIYLIPHDGNKSGLWKKVDGFVRRPEGGKNLDLAWLTVLRPGSSMERTVEMPISPPVGPGSYQASFRFPSPSVKNIQETHLPSGRLWFGELDAQLIVEVH